MPISTFTFGTPDHALPVALLSLAVLFRVISAGQGAVIQGMRRIYDLSVMGVLAALFATVTSIPLVYLMGPAGVAPALVASAALGLLASWWYSKKIAVEVPPMTGSEFRSETAALLKLGFAFAASGILTVGAAYAVRVMVVQLVGLDAAGLYQAAWTLGGLYVGIILQAMGTDFYPRLVAASDDHPECNRLVNEQAQVSMLLAAPGVIGTLTFAPIVVDIFYSANFGEAVGVLRWICLGIAMRVITWPVGYIVVAKNRQLLFFGVEVAWSTVCVGLTWLCLRQFGLSGAGIAFFVSYVFHGLIVYPLAQHLTGFHWSKTNLTSGMALVLLTVGVFCGFLLPSPLQATVLGSSITLMTGIYATWRLATLFPAEAIWRPVSRLLILAGLVRPGSRSTK
jgi:PST family polysaccharide transporter